MEVGLRTDASLERELKNTASSLSRYYCTYGKGQTFNDSSTSRFIQNDTRII